MQLRKPPLVEVWMSFRFEPAAVAPPWDRDRYNIFFHAVAETYPDLEEMVRQAVRVEASKKGGKPRIKGLEEQVLAMRAFTENRLRAVQLTPDELVVNYLRATTDPYPGFEALLDEALARCRQYAELYQPNGVIEAALHYVDVVSVPVPENKIIRTEEYFTLDFRVPEHVFGHFSVFEMRVIMRPPNDPEPVQLVFATIPGQAEETHRRFRLEWHTPVRGSRAMDDDELRGNIRAANARLENCFFHAFTPKGWALFEPVES
jgi:uncharacterized protein (TIGR04255 family)